METAVHGILKLRFTYLNLLYNCKLVKNTKPRNKQKTTKLVYRLVYNSKHNSRLQIITFVYHTRRGGMIYLKHLAVAAPCPGSEAA